MLTRLDEENNSIHEDESTVLIEETIELNASSLELSRSECLIEVLKFIVPYSVNELIVNGEFFIKSLIFAKLGKEELAANNLISTTQLVTIATAKAILISTNIYAARNSDSVSKLGGILRQSWLQAGIEAVPLILILSFTKPIFLSLKQDEQLSTIAGEFLRYSNIGLPAMLFLHSNQMFVIGLKRPNLALISTVITTGMTISLSYLFAFGAGRFPAFGVNGVAIATGISNWFSEL